MTHTPRRIVFATNNLHKLDEIRSIVGDNFEILSLKEIGCNEDIPETGSTLDENSLIKARYVRTHYGYDCFADDTGLEVEALSGAPGVRSARYAPGPGHDSQANMELLLRNMADKANRRARFRTVITLITDEGERQVEGVVEGTIARTPSGEGGFGYDPVFVPEGEQRSFAMMSAREKNAISHRGRAVEALLPLLNNL
ncbi:MAG: non-canonical purine NTP diphosphatase [Bacteroidales bacterium]|nr:non-canonical purine NTP diphosphatase [Bacteroidales bacterium]